MQLSQQLIATSGDIEKSHMNQIIHGNDLLPGISWRLGTAHFTGKNRTDRQNSDRSKYDQGS